MSNKNKRVSVRLSDTEQKQLSYIVDNANRNLKSDLFQQKLTDSDILRGLVREAYRELISNLKKEIKWLN